MRSNWILMALGLVVSVTALMLPAGADEGDDDTTFPKLKCELGPAFDECNAGLPLCTVLGATCYYCATPTDSKVRNCEPVDYHNECIVNPAGPANIKCGDKKSGTCVNNGVGGMSCQATYHSDCGSLKHYCT